MGEGVTVTLPTHTHSFIHSFIHPVLLRFANGLGMLFQYCSCAMNVFCGIRFYECFIMDVSLRMCYFECVRSVPLGVCYI